MKFTSVTSQRVIGSGETGKSNDFFFSKRFFSRMEVWVVCFFFFYPILPIQLVKNSQSLSISVPFILSYKLYHYFP